MSATGDWTKNLVHLAKTAELNVLGGGHNAEELVLTCAFTDTNPGTLAAALPRKHALTLQLHTAQILNAHGSLDEKNRAMQDLKEQKNKLESERARLLSCLRQVNEDRDKADMLEQKLTEEISGLQEKVKTLSEGEYASAKADVDRLRQELGQPPLPSLQSLLEEKTSTYLKELRLHVESQKTSAAKRTAEDGANGEAAQGAKRPRGRPKGSRNTKKPKPGEEGGSVISAGAQASPAAA